MYLSEEEIATLKVGDVVGVGDGRLHTPALKTIARITPTLIVLDHERFNKRGRIVGGASSSWYPRRLLKAEVARTQILRAETQRFIERFQWHELTTDELVRVKELLVSVSPQDSIGAK